MKRKILVTLLAFCLIASLCVVGAAAAAGEPCEGGESCNHEAAIGDVHYASLNDFLQYNAKPGDTIVVLKDCKINFYNPKNNSILDLNGHNVEYSGAAQIVFSGKGCSFSIVDSSAEVGTQGGTFRATGERDMAEAVFQISGGATFNVNNINIKSNGCSIYPFQNNTSVNIKDSKIESSGVYCLSTNAATEDNYGVIINISGSTLTTNANKHDNCAVMFNVRGSLNIENSSITGDRQAVLVRAGTANIVNSEITVTGNWLESLEAGTITGDNHTDGEWESGNEVPSAAIVVGNYYENAAGAYLADATVNVENTAITSNGDDVPAVYVDGNTTYQSNISLSGNETAVSGNVTIGQQALTEAMDIEVNGGSYSSSVAAYVADGLEYEANSDGVYTYHRTIESAVAAAGNDGSVSMISDGAAVGPDDEGVHTITLIDGGSEITMTVTDGYVYTLPELDKNGYTFTGWRVNSSNTIVRGGESYPITANTTFTAVWNMIMIPDTYDIAVDQPAHGTVDVSFSNASQGSVITVTATPDEGYELVYITVDGEPISGNSFVMPDHAVEVSALFAEIGKEVNFVDVSRADWFYDYVQYVAQNGLMEGTTRTAFEPNASMTRAMFWTVLARIDGETITGDAWKTLAQTWAVESGISDGTNADALITREQMVTMLYRYAGSPVTGGMAISEFTDGSSVSDYFADAVAWALSEGILTGMGDGILAPQGTATRAQAAAMLMRFVEA